MTPKPAGFNLALTMCRWFLPLLAVPLMGCIDLSLPTSHWDREVFEQAVAANPQNAHAHWSLGRQALRMGESREAIGHFEDALAADPDLTEARIGIGRCQLNLGKPSQAVAPLEIAVEESPDSAIAQALLGQALFEMGDVGAARRHLDEALRLDPACFPALATRGEMAYRQGNLAEALRDWRRASELSLDDPVWLSAQRHLGLLADDLEAYLRLHGDDR